MTSVFVRLRELEPRCPTCGSHVHIHTSTEGTSSYEPLTGLLLDIAEAAEKTHLILDDVLSFGPYERGQCISLLKAALIPLHAAAEKEGT